MLRNFLPLSLCILSLVKFTIAEANNPTTVSISPNELQNYGTYPTKVKNLLNFALELSKKNIQYRFGSADPAQGGMDCSGTIFYILSHNGISNPPRSSYNLYQWALEKGHFHAFNQQKSEAENWDRLKPGDLLFWSGTYTSANFPNVSHTMIYLGKNKSGAKLMIGASDGRTYQGQKIFGVSVFDFLLPAANSKVSFLGYSCIPQISC